MVASIYRVKSAPTVPRSCPHELSARLAFEGYEMHPRLFSDFSHKHFVTYSQSVPKEHRALLNA